MGLATASDVDWETAAASGGAAGNGRAAGGATEPAARAFFLGPDAGFEGQRFCVYHPPHGHAVRGWVVYVHPFAEEMNKSRRMAALQSRSLARAGYGVLQIDLLGCGDSSGDFADATWQAWVDDVARACLWVQRQGPAPLWLWGLRAGCLVAAQAAGRLAQPCNFVFWQAVPSGKLALHQFMRLKLAADLLAGQSKGAMEGLRAELAANRPVDVAGYRLAPALAAGLEAAVLEPTRSLAQGGHRSRIEWLEVQARSEPTLAPASLQALHTWHDAGFAVRSQAVGGPAFWQTTEVESAPLLLAATLAALTDRVP